jgi:hypothetical protein
MPKVGLYFYVNGNLLMEAVDISKAERYGDCQIGGSSHYEVWCSKYEKMYKKPYDYFPRGRVVFRFKECKFILYADKCISEKGVQDIIGAFELEKQNIEIDRDDIHYVCKNCNENYLE